MKYYAGIGSRETPNELVPEINRITKKLAEKGYILRSGGADGADKFFENGCDLAGGEKEIYLPWKGFNNNLSSLFNVSGAALEMAREYHPRWDKLNQAAQKLMARNCYQVLGFSLIEPVEFVVCWTKDGKVSGGTGQALRVALFRGISIYNLNNRDDCKELDRLLGSL